MAPSNVSAQAMQRRLLAAWAALGLLASGGCFGYQIGHQALFRNDIRTVHVPVFQSNSLRRNLEEWLTEAVVKQIQDTTPYRVVAADAADSVLRGRLVTHRKRVITEDRFDQPRDIEAAMVVEIEWVDRAGRPLIQRSTIPLPVGLTPIQRGSHFVPESGQSLVTAQQETVQRLARQIVGQMELGL